MKSEVKIRTTRVEFVEVGDVVEVGAHKHWEKVREVKSGNSGQTHLFVGNRNSGFVTMNSLEPVRIQVTVRQEDKGTA